MSSTPTPTLAVSETSAWTSPDYQAVQSSGRVPIRGQPMLEQSTTLGIAMPEGLGTRLGSVRLKRAHRNARDCCKGIQAGKLKTKGNTGPDPEPVEIHRTSMGSGPGPQIPKG